MTPVAPTPPEPTDPPGAASPLRTRGFAWWLPLVVAAVAAAAVFVLSERQEQVYESRAALIAPSGGVITPADLIDEIQADAVYEQTLRTLRLDTTVAALRERIDIAAAGVVIEVLARAPSAQEAQALARAFTTEARDPRLTNHGPLLDVYRAPLLPRRRTGGGTARNTGVATALGLVAGMGLALVAAGRERAAQPRLDVSALTGWPLLGALPRIAAPAGDVPARAFAALKADVEERRRARGFRVLLVTGMEPGDGATTVAVHLALAASRDGVNTTLVDAALARPGVHRALGIENGDGLVECLAAPTSVPSWLDPETVLEPPLPLQRLEFAPRGAATRGPANLPTPRLRVLTAGSMLPGAGRDGLARDPLRDPTAPMYRSPRLGEVLLQLTGESSLVIVDGPPLASEGGQALLRQSEAALVVVNALTGDPESIEEAAGTMAHLRERVIGAVVARAPQATVAAAAPEPPPQAPPAAVGAPPRGVAPAREDDGSDRPSDGPFRAPAPEAEPSDEGGPAG